MRPSPSMLAAGALLTGVLSWAATGAISAPPADPVDTAANEAFANTLAEVRADSLPSPLRAERRTMEDPWIARGDHYEVRTAASPRLASWAAASLDAQLEVFQEFLGTKRAPEQPFRVEILPDLATYSALGDEYDERSSITGGFYANGSGTGMVATYELENYNLMLEHIVYAAFLQYVDFLQPRRDVPVSLEHGLASFFAARASTDLATFTFSQFEAIRDGADADRPWTPLGELLQMPLISFAASQGNGTLGPARRVQLVQLVSFLQYYYEDTRAAEDGTPGVFQDYVRSAFTGGNAANHPILPSLVDPAGLAKLDGVLRAFRGWRGY